MKQQNDGGPEVIRPSVAFMPAEMALLSFRACEA